MSLLSLPSEIIYQIASYQTPPELYSFIRTHRRIAYLLGPLLTESVFRTCSVKYGERALTHAVRWGDKPTVKRLLNKGILSLTGLRICLQDGERSLRTLLACGLDTQARDHRGRTLLFLAAASGQESIILLLLNEPNTDIAAIDQHGRTVLHAAATAVLPGALELLLLLEDKTLDINQQDYNGNTPLHLAVLNKRAPTVLLLLARRDVDITLRNKRNLTAGQASQVDYRARDKTISDALLGRVLSGIRLPQVQPRRWEEVPSGYRPQKKNPLALPLPLPSREVRPRPREKEYPPAPPPPPPPPKDMPTSRLSTSVEWKPQFLPPPISRDIERSRSRRTKMGWERVRGIFAREREIAT